ncbi:MAG: hypothetical protein LBB53_03420, partial [Prevotellaceae bacterium]|nr:hypothetical protein [Prevotellaceae bacterium]
QRNCNVKAARYCTDKGFCSTKKMYFYGVKLHLLAFGRKGTIPFPNKIYFSRVFESGLNIVRELNWFGDFAGT